MYTSSFEKWERLAAAAGALCQQVMQPMSMREREAFVNSCWDTLRAYPTIYRRTRLRMEDPFEVEVLNLIIYGRFKDEIKLEVYIKIIEMCVQKLYA